jgi:hypothetical protein
MQVNICAAWLGILFGLLSGVALGLFFHRENWLGGYNSWPRRLLRLGHISFFGIALLNFAFVATANYLRIPAATLTVPSLLFVLAQITMPLVCFASAFERRFRHLFFIPVLNVIGATGIFLVHGVMR